MQISRQKKQRGSKNSSHSQSRGLRISRTINLTKADFEKKPVRCSSTCTVSLLASRSSASFVFWSLVRPSSPNSLNSSRPREKSDCKKNRCVNFIHMLITIIVRKNQKLHLFLENNFYLIKEKICRNQYT